VIRRAVEMESLQFVGCSWFISLIGLVSDSPEIKATENRTCVHPCSSPVSSRPNLDAPGVHSIANSKDGNPLKTGAGAPSAMGRPWFGCKRNVYIVITRLLIWDRTGPFVLDRD
jgi:hypothetical protein